MVIFSRYDHVPADCYTYPLRTTKSRQCVLKVVKALQKLETFHIKIFYLELLEKNYYQLGIFKVSYIGIIEDFQKKVNLWEFSQKINVYRDFSGKSVQ